MIIGLALLASLGWSGACETSMLQNGKGQGEQISRRWIANYQWPRLSELRGDIDRFSLVFRRVIERRNDIQIHVFVKELNRSYTTLEPFQGWLESDLPELAKSGFDHAEVIYPWRSFASGSGWIENVQVWRGPFVALTRFDMKRHRMLFHELGHHLFYHWLTDHEVLENEELFIQKGLRSTQTSKQLMPVVSKYAETNEREYFAEGVAAYVSNSAMLYLIDPDFYRFMHRLSVGQIEK